MTLTRRDILQVLEELSELYPDMRLGQLVVNIANWASRVPDGLWDVEDAAFLEAARRHLDRRGKQASQRAPASGATAPGEKRVGDSQ